MSSVIPLASPSNALVLESSAGTPWDHQNRYNKSEAAVARIILMASEFEVATSTIKTFMRDRLEPRLVEIERDRAHAQRRAEQFLQIENYIALVQKQDLQEMDSMVDLGSHFYVNVNVPDPKTIFIDIGFGFHTEFTFGEALEFIDDVQELLEARVERFRCKADAVKERIIATRNELHQLEHLHDVEIAQQSGRLV